MSSLFSSYVNETKTSGNSLFFLSVLDNRIQPVKHLTIPSVLTVIHTDHICLDVLLHQLAAINTSPPSTCVRSSGIWAALSEVCCCIIRISAGTLSPSLWTLICPRRVSFPAAACAFLHNTECHSELINPNHSLHISCCTEATQTWAEQL